MSSFQCFFFTLHVFTKFIFLCVTQGPTGAQGAPGDAGDPGPMVRLYINCMINILTFTGKLFKCACNIHERNCPCHIVQVKQLCHLLCNKDFFLCRALLVQGDQMVLQEKLVQMWVDQQFAQWLRYLNIIVKQNGVQSSQKCCDVLQSLNALNKSKLGFPVLMITQPCSSL